MCIGGNIEKGQVSSLVYSKDKNTTLSSDIFLFKALFLFSSGISRSFGGPCAKPRVWALQGSKAQIFLFRITSARGPPVDVSPCALHRLHNLLLRHCFCPSRYCNNVQLQARRRKPVGYVEHWPRLRKRLVSEMQNSSPIYSWKALRTFDEFPQPYGS